MKIFLVFSFLTRWISLVCLKKWCLEKIISNTDRNNESGTHWWSILNISSKSKILFFDSFEISGMKRFIVTNDKKVIRKVLKGLEIADKKDDKLTL